MKTIRIRRRKRLDASRDEQQPFIKQKNSEKEPEERSNPGFFSGGRTLDIQSKLKISQPGDQSEVQADKMADKIVNKQETEEEETQTKLQKQEEEVQEKVNRQEEEEEMQTRLQKQEEEEEPVQAQPQVFLKESQKKAKSLETKINEAKQGGFPLPDDFRKEMETEFAADFSHVRIHTNKQAIQLCKQMNAQAFTTGNHIFFNQGMYRPNTRAGRFLLAHELTHVLQQGEG